MKRFLLCCSSVVLLFSCHRGDQEVVKTSYYHYYGPAISASEWKSQGSNGVVATVQRDGVEVRRSYADGVLHGPSTWSYPHSKIVEYFEEYSEGKKIASGHNLPSGAPETAEESISQEDTLARAWYEDGSPRLVEHTKSGRLLEGQYYTNDGDVESAVVNGDGVRVTRTTQGVLLSREQLVNGEVVLKETFHTNGIVSETVSYQGGKKHGARKCFDEAGRPEVLESYTAGCLSGTSDTFREGVRVSSISYIDGKKDGKELHYSPDSGVVVEEILWIDDDKHGASTQYGEGGTIVEWFWRGVPVTEDQFKRNDETVKASQASRR